MIRGAAVRIPQNKPLSIRSFLGMDITGTRDVRRSPDMMNCVLDDEGTPEMRCGYEKEFAVSLGAGRILGIHRWRSPQGVEHRVIHHGTKLYVCTAPKQQPTLLYTGMGGTEESTSFQLGGKLGIIDGTAFVIYDGITAVDCESIAYIPTRFIGRGPTGGGTVVEDFNLMQPRWIEKFTTVTAQQTYPISDTNLDAIEWVKLNGVTKVLTTDYTVNLSAGTITLTANPGNAPTANNLEVQSRKLRAGYADRIKKCKFSQTYGGPNDSKVFVSGNSDYPHIDWWTGTPLSGAYDPTFWPDTNFDRVGGDNDPIYGYAVQYDRMVVKKRRSLYLRQAEITTDAYGRTVTRFPSYPLTYGIGCAEYHSIQVLENNPVFLSDTGVYELEGTNVRDERNVRCISPLVSIPLTGSGASIDHGGKYYLAVGDNTVWVCDYKRTVKNESDGKYVPVWYPWNNMPVACWCHSDTDLYFGSNSIGMVYRMKTKADPLPYNDDGAPIPCHFNLIFTTFDRDDMTKLVQNVIIRMKPWTHAELDISYNTEQVSSGNIHVERIDLLNFADIDFNNFSFLTSNYPQGFSVRIDDARDIQMFQLCLESSGQVNDFFGLASIDIVFIYLAQLN